jgi:N-acyl-D-aspartate/D-glutamate deacylase
MNDLIIQNGKIVDGTGKPAFIGDIAIKDGKISAIGYISAAATSASMAEIMLVIEGFSLIF